MEENKKNAATDLIAGNEPSTAKNMKEGRNIIN